MKANLSVPGCEIEFGSVTGTQRFTRSQARGGDHQQIPGLKVKRSKNLPGEGTNCFCTEMP